MDDGVDVCDQRVGCVIVAQFALDELAVGLDGVAVGQTQLVRLAETCGQGLAKIGGGAGDEHAHGA